MYTRSVPRSVPICPDNPFPDIPIRRKPCQMPMLFSTQIRPNSYNHKRKTRLVSTTTTTGSTNRKSLENLRLDLG